MALGDNYITAQELKDYMAIQGTGYDARIAAVCSAVSRDVEDYCHRQFNLAGSVSARKYYPIDRGTCHVDDFATTVGLIIQSDEDGDGVFETTWATTDYELHPLNGVRNGRPGWPFWRIGVAGFNKRFHWGRNASVQVTANWGWTTVPDPVKEACFMLGADTFQMKDTRLGIGGADQFGTVVRVRDSVMAQAKLKNYCRQKVFQA